MAFSMTYGHFLVLIFMRGETLPGAEEFLEQVEGGWDLADFIAELPEVQGVNIVACLERW